jgi:uncharacterized protein with ATP-grasp and redox domains
MMTDEPMTDQELQEMRDRIWKSSKEEIKKNVEYAISSSLHSRMGTWVHRRINSEISNILEPLLQENKAKLEETARRMVTLIFSNMQKKLEEAMRYQIEDLGKSFIGWTLEQHEFYLKRSVENIFKRVSAAALAEEKEHPHG